MGKVINSTNLIESAMKNKSRLPKNMSKDNYYLKRLQQKVDYEWDYRYNVVDIEEEIKFGSEKYDPIEVIIQSVFSEKDRKYLSDDWKRITFRDIQHPIDRGKRYKFSLDFGNPDLEEIDKSIWITVNYNSTSPTSNVVIRRCNTNVAIVADDKSEIHREPAILEDDFKYVSFYYDETITLAQAEIYLIMQYNQYTKNIIINDRFLIGPTDSENRENNTIFKVKAMRRYYNAATFKDGDERLLFLALDKDDLGCQPDDDVENRVVVHAPYYKKNEIIKEEDHENKQYHIEVITKDNTKYDNRLLLNKKREFLCYLYDENNNKIDDVNFTVETDLLSTDNDIYYYDFVQINDNEFSILNKKMYLKDKLKISCKTSYDNQDFEKIFYINLGGNT